jgi:hypothetical protein
MLDKAEIERTGESNMAFRSLDAEFFESGEETPRGLQRRLATLGQREATPSPAAERPTHARLERR